MYCGKCGIKVERNAKFCPNCGTQLRSDNPSGATIDLWNLIAIPFLWLLHEMMASLKKTGTKNGIKIGAAVLALLLLVVLLSNSFGGYNKKFLGEWYEEGHSIVEFTLYDDGSCTEGNSMQKGTWRIVNKNQLHITSPWSANGRTRIFTIISADSNKLVLAQHYAGGPGTMEPTTYWHTPRK